jgi:GT2 family glycosyltransferase
MHVGPARHDYGWPLVTVVILARDRREKLRTTLERLRDTLDYPPELLETIVVDNASSDHTPSMVEEEFPGVSLISNARNVGIAGWNQGFERGRGDYFLVLDDDCYLSGDSLLRAVKMAGESESDLVSFTAVSTSEPGFVFNHEYETGLLAFWGCAALISRRAITLLGGFDPSIFVWAHEPEFTMRLLDRGLRHLFVPDIVAHHMTDPGARLTPFFYRTNARNLSYIAAKLLRRRHAIVAIANILSTSFLRSRRPITARNAIAVVAGAWAGTRRRAPVGPGVSALYRWNYIEFVNPLQFLRGLTAGGIAARCRRFWRKRPDLYPADAAWLQM